MDPSSSCSNPHPLGSNTRWTDVRYTATLSDSQTQVSGHSDEEVILASTRPKKRARRKKFKETRHPVYRGVRRRNSNKWVCELREPNKKSRIWLGTYPILEMAARAHDVAALALRGHLACLNFADSVWRLPIPVSKDAKDIRKAAAEAAEAFRPRDCCKKSGGEMMKDSEEASDDGEVSGGDTGEASHGGSSKLTAEEDEDEDVKSTFKENDNVLYMDEEAMFDMPGFIVSMAEGLLLSPPPCLTNGFSWDGVEADAEVSSLWSFSV